MTPEGSANYFMATLNSFRVVTAVHVYGSQATSDGRDPSSNAKPCIVLLLLVKACMHERKCGSLVLDCDGQGEATYCDPWGRSNPLGRKQAHRDLLSEEENEHELLDKLEREYQLSSW